VPSFFGEEDVIVLAAVEGRVAVDQIDGFVLDVLAEDTEVVAVVELIFLHDGFGLPGDSNADGARDGIR